MIVLIGEALVDVIKGVAYPGGCQFNSSLSARRLGVPVTLLDNISRDDYGKQILSRLNEEGIIVPPEFLGDRRPTLSSTVALDGEGKAKYIFTWEGCASLGMDAEKLERALESIDNVEAILFGSVSAMLEPFASAVKSAIISYRKRHGETTIFLDPNVRPTLIPDKAEYCAWMKGLISLVDMMKLSDEDLAFLMGHDAYEDNVRALRAWHDCELVITRGAKGSEWHHGGKVFKAKAGDVKVVDTVGAGDTVNGVLLRALHVIGRKPKEFSDEECQSTLDLASRAADINCTRQGCDPPTARELGLETGQPNPNPESLQFPLM